jgi:hypothetical protein
VPEHTNGLQVREGGATHCPAALHLGLSVKTPFAQISGPHSVSISYFSQAPVPSHRPSVPQDATPVSLQVLCGSAAPFATFLHWPGDPGSAQLRHAPVHADSQHTPSTHWPDSQSVAAEHFCPLPSLPLQRPTLTPPTVACTQGWLGAQSASVAQVAPQAPFAQRKGVQSTSWRSPQTPSPSQVRGTPRVVSPVQEGALHRVLVGKFEHVPKPSQSPVVSQVLRSVTAQKAGSGRPASIRRHTPFEPTWLHAMQAPAQASLQQTLSLQKPEAQSSGPAQPAPFIFLPQLLF